METDRYLLNLLWIIAALLPGCESRQDQAPSDPTVLPAKERLSRRGAMPPVKFTDVTAKAGIGFQHINGAFGKKLLPETLGSGCAFLDFDNDGYQDLLLVNSCYWPGFGDDRKPAPTLALYRNQGDGTFADVTAAAGLNVTLYGLGVTVGDYDNDGWPDVFITAVGGCRLFHNEGGQKFVDVTGQAGDLLLPSPPGGEGRGRWPRARGQAFLDVQGPIAFPSSAAFLDYDNDGLLDLFVCHYVTWSPHYDLHQEFTLTGLGRAYGPPRFFEGTQCALYRNQGAGRFADVSRQAGIHVEGELGKPVAKALGVTVCDVDEDGWPDIVVANDTVRNFFFHNQGHGTFKEKGQEAGIAYAEGTARGAMGIDWGEYRPGQCALLIGNFANEPDTFLRRDDAKNLLFSDVALLEGIAGPSRLPLVFGLFFFDYDLDGRLDFLTCNGHLEPEINRVQASQQYRQPPQLYWNTGQRPAFDLVGPEQAGPDLFAPLVGRGCAYADIDGDGDPDVVLIENGGPARLLRNDGGTGHNWIRLVLAGDGKRCNRSAIGARVVLTAGGKVQKRELCSAKGYLSQSELPLTFGLGKDLVESVAIHWPGVAQPQVLKGLEANRVHRMVLK